MKWPSAAGILLLLSFTSPASADGPGALTVSGFFDVGVEPNSGTLEIEFVRALGRRVRLTASAVAVQTEGVALGVAHVDAALVGENALRVQVGQFDVPFGNDWQLFASKDRTELTAPITTDTLMRGGVTAPGLRLYGSTESINYSAVALRDGVYGARLGITPRDGWELGVSALNEATAMDASARIGRFRARAEYLRNDLAAGWHVTTAFDAGSAGNAAFTPFLRYEPERLTAGMNTNLHGVLLLKLEHSRGNDAAETRAQIVLVF